MGRRWWWGHRTVVGTAADIVADTAGLAAAGRTVVGRIAGTVACTGRLGLASGQRRTAHKLACRMAGSTGLEPGWWCRRRSVLGCSKRKSGRSAGTSTGTDCWMGWLGIAAGRTADKLGRTERSGLGMSVDELAGRKSRKESVGLEQCSGRNS